MKDPADKAWTELRALAGEKAMPYALSHEDGWSRNHLLLAAYNRLIAAFQRAAPQGTRCPECGGTATTPEFIYESWAGDTAGPNASTCTSSFHEEQTR